MARGRYASTINFSDLRAVDNGVHLAMEHSYQRESVCLCRIRVVYYPSEIAKAAGV